MSDDPNEMLSREIAATVEQYNDEIHGGEDPQPRLMTMYLLGMAAGVLCSEARVDEAEQTASPATALVLARVKAAMVDDRMYLKGVLGVEAEDR